MTQTAGFLKLSAMMNIKRPSLSSPRDVDLLLLIREEEVYADRIRNSLVLTESRMHREPALLVIYDQEIREANRLRYERPVSEIEEEHRMPSSLQPPPTCRRKPKKDRNSDVSVYNTVPYMNPPLDRRLTVEDEDALYSQASVAKGRVMFTYEDLIATREKRKIITVRALRRLANLWLIDPKLNKEQMLNKLIEEYSRRYRDEVEAYNHRSTTTVRPRPLPPQRRRR